MRVKNIILSGITALTLASLMATSAYAQNAEAKCGPMIYGDWVTDDGSSVVTIKACEAGKICGYLSFLKAADRDALDGNNKDPELRSRKLLGANLLTNFSKKSGNKYKGKIYNPNNGKTYKSFIKTAQGNILNVKGCLGPFCESQIWTRPATCPLLKTEQVLD